MVALASRNLREGWDSVFCIPMVDVKPGLRLTSHALGSHHRDPGPHLAVPDGVNPGPRSRRSGQLATLRCSMTSPRGGIGRAAGLTPFGAAETICGQRG